jgi:pimeloyl-ACP methyl ester carboxylesterase
MVMAGLQHNLPGLQRSIVVDDAGHWIQQERADDVNAALLDFLGSLKR